MTQAAEMEKAVVPSFAALEQIVTAIVRDVAELPDRTSPEYDGDMMLVTAEELASIVRQQFIDANGELVTAPSLSLSGRREEIARVLREHWLTGIECDHATNTDTAHCYCTVWKSDPMPSVGAAVEAWIVHVLAASPPRSAEGPTEADKQPSDSLLYKSPPEVESIRAFVAEKET